MKQESLVNFLILKSMWSWQLKKKRGNLLSSYAVLKYDLLLSNLYCNINIIYEMSLARQ